MTGSKKVNALPPDIIGLQALAYVAGDDDLAPRFLALTGMDSDTLRARAGDALVLAAVIEFLGNHESDLIACAEALGMAPAALANAGVQLAGEAA